MKWIGIILACACAIPAAGTMAQTTQPSGQLARWLADLGSETWRAREAAEAALVRYGPDAVPALNQLIRQNPDLEVQSRAHEILRRIQSWPLYAKFVTVHLHQVPARAAFAEIAAAAGMPLPAADAGVWNAPLPTVTLDFDRAPFWNVVVEACRQAHLCLQLDPADLRTVELRRGDIGNPCISQAILGIPPQEAMTFDTGAMNLKFPLIAEPDVRILECPVAENSQPLWSFEEALDENGRSYAIESPSITDATESGHWVEAMLDSDRPVHEFSSIRIKACVILQSEGALLEVGDFGRLATASAVSSGLTLTATRTGPMSATVSIRRGPFSAQQADLIDRYFKVSTRLLDEQGRPFETASSDLSLTRSAIIRHIVFSQTAGSPPRQPQKLLIDVPTAVRQILIPLSWRDVVLRP